MTTTDPNTPAAQVALQHACGLCKASPGEPCRTDRLGKMHWFRTLGASL